DAWKLANWSAFSQSLAPRHTRWRLPASSVLHYDNSASLDHERLSLIEQFVYGGNTDLIEINP
ncbi:hypothetical protein K0U00_50055, partial [Paenibacillus sepulcri]|nr:hypothetical protein [Paenibacillus sepulcri]